MTQDLLGVLTCTARQRERELFATPTERFGRPLWEMQPADADSYFGKVLRDARPSTRTGRAAALTVFFQFLELRHKVELHNLTGRVVECPLDEINRPRAPRGSASPGRRSPARRPGAGR